MNELIKSNFFERFRDCMHKLTDSSELRCKNRKWSFIKIFYVDFHQRLNDKSLTFIICYRQRYVFYDDFSFWMKCWFFNYSIWLWKYTHTPHGLFQRNENTIGSFSFHEISEYFWFWSFYDHFFKGKMKFNLFKPFSVFRSSFLHFPHFLIKFLLLKKSPKNYMQVRPDLLICTRYWPTSCV